MHYLDHAATTPMHPAALAAMTDQLAVVGNASSLHTSGRAARRVVEESRESIAGALGCRPSEVVFTSGGTESDNLALAGTFAARRDADPRRTRLLVSAVEHHAVLDCADFLVAHEGATVTWLECDSEGRVSPDTVRSALAQDPDSASLVSVMWANNEVGTVQDIAGITAVAHEFGVPVHTDAVQAFGHLPLDLAAADVEMAAVTAHKLGGPVGVGALAVKREHALVPSSHGGGQERQVRSGTLDVAGIRAFAVAVEHAMLDRESEAVRLAGLRDRLVAGAMGLGLGIVPGGPWTPGDVTTRLPGSAHLLVPGCEGDSLLYLLDAAGIECSTGSACQAGVPRPSHVLLAMGLSDDQARGALRLSLGRTSTEQDVDAVLDTLPAAVDRARRAAGTALPASAGTSAGAA